MCAFGIGISIGSIVIGISIGIGISVSISLDISSIRVSHTDSGMGGDTTQTLLMRGTVGVGTPHNIESKSKSLN